MNGSQNIQTNHSPQCEVASFKCSSLKIPPTCLQSMSLNVINFQTVDNFKQRNGGKCFESFVLTYFRERHRSISKHKQERQCLENTRLVETANIHKNKPKLTSAVRYSKIAAL